MAYVRKVLVAFIFVYILISLPTMLGIGYVIDWVPEATLLQRLKGYIIGGLLENYNLKIIASFIIGLIPSLVLFIKR